MSSLDGIEHVLNGTHYFLGDAPLGLIQAVVRLQGLLQPRGAHVWKHLEDNDNYDLITVSTNLSGV